MDNGWIDQWMDVCTDGRADGWMDDVRTDRRMVG
jgi:hypothetical protein